MDIKDQKNFKEVMLKYNFAKSVLETELDILIDEYEFVHGYNPVEHKKSRIKCLDSAIKKLKRKNFDITTDNATG